MGADSEDVVKQLGLLMEQGARFLGVLAEALRYFRFCLGLDQPIQAKINHGTKSMTAWRVASMTAHGGAGC
jgi:hypothetical protein